jgi:hypothetical protein
LPTLTLRAEAPNTALAPGDESVVKVHLEATQ